MQVAEIASHTRGTLPKPSPHTSCRNQALPCDAVAGDSVVSVKGMHVHGCIGCVHVIAIASVWGFRFGSIGLPFCISEGVGLDTDLTIDLDAASQKFLPGN